MKALLVTHYFPPEIGAPQARLSEFAQAWAERGHDVTVLTGMPNHPTGVVPDAYRGARLRRERVDGYRILRTWLYATPNEGFLRKVLGHLSFMLSAVLLGTCRVGRQDVVVASSPTFFSLFSAWFIARVKRARFVVEVRDLWPAIFVELGVLTNPMLIRLLERLELAVYRAADHIVLVSEGFRDALEERGVPADKLSVIRNGVDLERFGTHMPRTEEARARLGARAPEDVVVLYLGAHGISHGLTAVADAAAKLQDLPGVRFAFVGEGAAKADLLAWVEELGLDNVLSLPGVPREHVPELLAAADICLAPLRDVPLFSTFIPSKIFEYLGSSRAVIGSLRGEPARILEEAGAVVVEPEQPEALAEAVRTLASDAERRESMGAQGRRYVEANFDRRQLAEQYTDIFRAITEQSA
jgi:glycosyltransferase involved in cell wall biosynthesis